METKEIILKQNANIFGFNIKKGSNIISDENGSVVCKTKDDKDNDVSYKLLEQPNIFNYSPKDFYREAEKVNHIHDEIEKEGGRLPIFEIDITNPEDRSLTAVLFATNQYLLTTNFGSAVGINVTPSASNVSYLELLQQSAHLPVRVDYMKLESESDSQITQIIHIDSRDANGQFQSNPLITQSYFNPTEAKLHSEKKIKDMNIAFPFIIDGNTSIKMTILPNTKLKVKIYGSQFEYSERIIRAIQAIISCQMQQGLDVVEIMDIKRYYGLNYDFSSLENYLFSEESLESEEPIKKQLKELQKFNFIYYKDGGYGFNFSMIKLDGTKHTNLPFTTALQMSEINLKK